MSRPKRKVVVGVLVIIALLYGCTSVMVCCSDKAEVHTDPKSALQRSGGKMIEDVVGDVVKPDAPGGFIRAK